MQVGKLSLGEVQGQPGVSQQLGVEPGRLSLAEGPTEVDPTALGSLSTWAVGAEGAIQEGFSEEEAPSLRLAGAGQWGAPGSVQRWIWEAWRRRKDGKLWAGGKVAAGPCADGCHSGAHSLG